MSSLPFHRIQQTIHNAGLYSIAIYLPPSLPSSLPPNTHTAAHDVVKQWQLLLSPILYGAIHVCMCSRHAFAAWVCVCQYLYFCTKSYSVLVQKYKS